MEIFRKAKVVRLRSHRDKYLLADEEKDGVYQHRNGFKDNAKWSVEIVENTNFIRLKSYYGKYLTATNNPFLLGATGKKVTQTLPSPRGENLRVQWEPIRDGMQVSLKNHCGLYLRANGGPPPWRNSITHYPQRRTSFANYLLWDVDLVEIRPEAIKPRKRPIPITMSNPSLYSTPLDLSPCCHAHSVSLDTGLHTKSPTLDEILKRDWIAEERRDSSDDDYYVLRG